MTCDLQGKYQLVSELYNIVLASWMKLFYIHINNAGSSHIKSCYVSVTYKHFNLIIYINF
jgi:hypothetical protein